MLRIIAAGLAVFVLLLAGVAITSEEQRVQAGDPDCFDGADGADQDGLIDTQTPPSGPDPDCVGVTPTAEPSPSPSPATATATAAVTTATPTAAAGTGTPTARAATPAVTPAAVPGTGGEPGSSTSLLLILALGAGLVAGTAGLAGIAVTRRG
jgi:hypothetical protein